MKIEDGYLFCIEGYKVGEERKRDVSAYSTA
jgi:hypothetical protein